MNAFVAEIEDYWTDHPTFQSPTWKTLLPEDLNRCIEIAGDIKRACALLQHIGEYKPEITAAVGNSKKLGSYLVRCFPEWCTRFGTEAWAYELEKEKQV